MKDKGPKVSRNRIGHKPLTARDNAMLDLALKELKDWARHSDDGDQPNAAAAYKNARRILTRLIEGRPEIKPEDEPMIIELESMNDVGFGKPVEVKVYGESKYFVPTAMEFASVEDLTALKVHMKLLDEFLRERGEEVLPPPKVHVDPTRVLIHPSRVGSAVVDAAAAAAAVGMRKVGDFSQGPRG